MRAVSRSVTSAEPSGWNASPHGARRSVTTSVTLAVRASGAAETEGSLKKPRQAATPPSAAARRATTVTTVNAIRARLTVRE
jgi:hypothetical protein